MDITEVRKETRLSCNESVLTLLSGARKSPAITFEDKAYNNALADVYDFILEKEKNNLLNHTVWCGKWIRD